MVDMSRCDSLQPSEKRRMCQCTNGSYLNADKFNEDYKIYLSSLFKQPSSVAILRRCTVFKIALSVWQCTLGYSCFYYCNESFSIIITVKSSTMANSANNFVYCMSLLCKSLNSFLNVKHSSEC